MLNRTGESGLPCLLPGLRETAASLSPLSMMFADGWFFVGALTKVEEGLLLLLVCRVFVS